MSKANFVTRGSAPSPARGLGGGAWRSLLWLALVVWTTALPAFAQWNLPSLPRVKTEQLTYSTADRIMVEFSNLPGNYRGLIALAKKGSRDDVVGTWQEDIQYQQQGILDFDPLPAGDYEVRLYYDYPNILTVQARSGFRVTASRGVTAPGGGASLPTTTPLGPTSIKTGKSTYSTGEKIVVEFGGLSSTGSQQDWIGLYQKGSPDNATAAGGQAHSVRTTSGSTEFSALPVGNYEARLYKDGFVQARFPFRVAISGPASIKASKSVYTSSEQIVVEASNLTGEGWITLNTKGSDDTESAVQGQWKHTHIQGKPQDTLYFSTLPIGEYEARLFMDGAVRARYPFRVQDPPTIKTQKNTYFTGEVIVVEFRNLPSGERDLIAISKKGSPDNDVAWNRYIDKQAQGEIVFPSPKRPPDAGDYEARLYFDFPAAGFKVQARHSFEIRSGSSPSTTPVPLTPAATLQMPTYSMGRARSFDFRVPGQLRNARGANAQLVLHFYFWLPNTAGWVSLDGKPGSGYQDIAGKVATWVNFPVGYDPYDLGTLNLNIPVDALHLLKTQTWNIGAQATLFVDNVQIQTSPLLSFFVNPR